MLGGSPPPGVSPHPPSFLPALAAAAAASLGSALGWSRRGACSLPPEGPGSLLSPETPPPPQTGEGREPAPTLTGDSET